MTRPISWSVAWRLARRDLSSGFRGLRLLLVCLFLGVGALTAIGTLTGAIERQLDERGQQILGGDIEVRVWQRGLSAAEREALDALGPVSIGTRMQAIALKGDVSAPVSLKAVDTAWPLYGTFSLKENPDAGAPRSDEAWLAEGAAERLEAAVGDTITIGNVPLRIGGIIADEPDRLSEGFALGPPVIVALDLPRRARLTTPGAMYRTVARVRLPPERSPDAAIKDLEKRFPDAGLTYRTRARASPGTDRFVENMGQFLVLIGLSALVIAGIGIGGGVSSYLEARRPSIATLKVLGASSRDIQRIYQIQIAVAALLGSAAGAVAGVLVTPLMARALSGLLPVEAGFTLDAQAILVALAYGLLVAMVFAAPPLAKARAFPAMALMRARVSPLATSVRALAVPVGTRLALIVALALVTASNRLTTAWFLAGAAAVLALLGALGWGIRVLAARMPRPANPLLRTGLANLYRPGAQTGALVTALGFGLSAFVLLAAVETSLYGNIRSQVPQRAPDYFVLDVPKDRVDAFRATVRTFAPRAEVRTVPALRGKILAYGPRDAMTRVSDLENIPEDAWPLRGERGLTYADTVPDGNVVTRGDWWPGNYDGEPLVSIDGDLAEAVGLRIGDYLTVSLLGVERTARIASFRRIDWDSLGFNYVLVFSPNALEDAPHNLAATIDIPEGESTRGLLVKLVRAFPSTSVIETGAILRDARAILSQMANAILAAASVAVLAGLAVLLGAIAAARASRTYDNVILRVLGASRRQLLLIQLAEYGFLALVLAVVALGLGSAIGWGIMTRLFEFEWLPDWPTVLAVLGAGLALVIGFALAGSLPLLRAKPAQSLREL